MTEISPESSAQVGICVLNYHYPVETVRCIETLMRAEPLTTRVIWIENDARTTEPAMRAALEQAAFPWVVLRGDEAELPPSGTVAVLLSPENLGYGGGNNLGLRLLHRAGVPYAWVLNNDTELTEGCSRDLLAAAEARPEVGAWGTAIHARHHRPNGDEVDAVYFGGVVSLKDFGITLACTVQMLESEPLAYISGCSLFAKTSVFAEAGFIPEDYFLYYEDPAFTFELKKLGYKISGLDSVRIDHEESLATGRRSAQLNYYNRRNRWEFIRRYFPAELRAQRWMIFYTLQKFLFRGKLEHVRVELMAYRDFRQGKLGRTGRSL